jgi:hypothetical protein
MVLLLLLDKGPQGANCTECLWNKNKLRKGYFWPIRIGVRHTGISLGYLFNEALLFKIILYDFVRWVNEGYYILSFLNELTVFQLFNSLARQDNNVILRIFVLFNGFLLSYLLCLPLYRRRYLSF